MNVRAFRSAVVLARLGVVIAASAAAQNTVTVRFQDGISPTSRYAGTHDTTITVEDDPDGDPTANYGGRLQLRAGGFPARHTSLLLFPLDGGVPRNSIITGAYLSLAVAEGSTTGFSAYEVLQPWSELEATYRNASSGQSWGLPGASEPWIDRSGIPFATFGRLDPLVRANISLTDAGLDVVRKWYGGGPQHGIAIQDFDSWDGLRISARESADYPKLYVSYNSTAGAGTASIQASADTFLGFRPAILDGWGLRLSGQPERLSSSLVRFDLRAIPPGVQVQTVRMKLSVNRISSSQGFAISRVLQPWTESATWDRYNGVNAWAISGAQGLSADHDAPQGAMPACAEHSDCLFSLPNMVSVIQGWVDNPASNLGFLIQDYANGQEAQLFDSETGNPALRPALEITFSAAASSPLALFPARATVSTGERVQMMALGGTGPYTYSISNSGSGSGGSIDAATGLYTAGGSTGQDQIIVQDQSDAQAFAIIEVLPRPAVTPDAGSPDAGQVDGGQPDAGSGVDGGNLPPISIFLEGTTNPLVAQQDFSVRAEIQNNGSSQVSGLVLLLAPVGLSVGAPALEGGGALTANGAGYDLPPISADDKVRVSIPARVTALPGDPLSLTASVESGGALADSATLNFTLQGPPPFQTSCGCGAGPGSLGLLALVSAIFTLRARRQRAGGAERSGAARRVGQ